MLGTHALNPSVTYSSDAATSKAPSKKKKQNPTVQQGDQIPGPRSLRRLSDDTPRSNSHAQDYSNPGYCGTIRQGAGNGQPNRARPLRNDRGYRTLARGDA